MSTKFVALAKLGGAELAHFSAARHDGGSDRLSAPKSDVPPKSDFPPKYEVLEIAVCIEPVTRL